MNCFDFSFIRTHGKREREREGERDAHTHTHTKVNGYNTHNYCYIV